MRCVQVHVQYASIMHSVSKLERNKPKLISNIAVMLLLTIFILQVVNNELTGQAQPENRNILVLREYSFKIISSDFYSYSVQLTLSLSYRFNAVSSVWQVSVVRVPALCRVNCCFQSYKNAIL